MNGAKLTDASRALQRFRPYPVYKDSGVAWLGEIPEHWSNQRLKSLLRALESGRREDSPSIAGDDTAFSIGGEHIGSSGELLLGSERFVSGSAYDRMNAGKVLAGDVLLVKDGATIGKTAHVGYLPFPRMAVNEHVFILRPTRDVVPIFLYYVIASDLAQFEIELSVRGAAQPGLPSSFAADVICPLPPILEQRAIAAFLDRETARIDALVARKERLIQLLQEQRTILITRAVTKGLDLAVPMRDSGVAWLGQIPAHWNVRKLKHVCERVFVGIAEAATFAYVDSGIPMLRSTDVRANHVRTDEIRRIDRRFAERLLTKQLRSGDIVTVRTGNAGVSAVVPAEYDGGQCFTLVVSRPAGGHDSRYFCYWLNAPAGQQQFAIEGVGTAQINISVPIVQNVIVCVPPSQEQSQVAEFLEAELAHRDSLICKIRTAINRLQELRSALISCAVAGKIDVREQVA